MGMSPHGGGGGVVCAWVGLCTGVDMGVSVYVWLWT